MDRQSEKSDISSSATMSAPERPPKAQFYVVRQNGNATPLVAMDELPQHITIEGVPRLLSTEDIDDMVRVPGKFESRQNVYRVTDESKPPAPVVPDRAATGFGFPRPKVVLPNPNTPKPDDEAVFPGPKKYFGIEEEAPKQVSDTPAPEVETRNPSAFDKFEPLPGWKIAQNIGDRRPLKGKKIYCSHWMSTGECDYAQQGCLYKHVMPLDIELLQHLGFRDIPKWYRERHGIGKLTAVPGSGAHIEGPASPPSHTHATWRPLLNQRLPRATPLASARSRVFPGASNRRLSSTHVLAPRPTRVIPQDLISLESRPVTPLAATNTKSSKSPLNSKFATLQPVNENSKSQDSPSSKEEESSGKSTTMRLSNGHQITPNTSVESLTALKSQDSIDRSDYIFKMREMTVDRLSRRTSIATDYETGLFQEQKERDEQELQASVEYSAVAASRREQAELNKKQEAALAAARQLMLGGQKSAVSSNSQRDGTSKKGSRRSGSGRGAGKKNESVRAAAEIKV